jgi:Ni,Fe-hydrogenase maturation factor
MTDYLRQSFNFELITIGIQPKSLAFGASPSKETLKATKLLSTTIAKLLNKR